jgi:hypothetical protein
LKTYEIGRCYHCFGWGELDWIENVSDLIQNKK